VSRASLTDKCVNAIASFRRPGRCGAPNWGRDAERSIESELPKIAE
jgi:hypothetical protein